MAPLDGGATLVVAESFGNRLSAFTVGSDGTLAARRDWASVGPTPASDDLPSMLAEVAVVPDGICAAGGPDGLGRRWRPPPRHPSGRGRHDR